MSYTRSAVCVLACAVAFFGYAEAGTEASKAKSSSDKVPITTKSEEAKQLYIKGRDLAEKLRATDARAQYRKAVALDKDFAMAHVGLANTSGTAKEFFDATTRAASLAPKVSEGERHIILGLEAGMRGDPASTLNHYQALVKLFPNDERAHTLLGNTFFGRQDYETAIKHLERAVEINPSFSQPYNQLGYAYRFLNRYDDAERTFQKYTELIPDDPNPHDSYAELLMKMGRFDDSIKNYQKALSIDPNFIASHIGIGNNYLYKGDPEKARIAFAKINEVARNTGERRQSHFWTAATYVHEGKTDKAIEEIKAGTALAKAENDAGGVAGDLNQIGDILREAGRYDEALASYREGVSVLEKSQVPPEVKSAGKRNLLFEEGRVAALTNKLPEAKAKSAEYAKQVAVKKVPFEVRQQHELSGMIAQAEKRYAEAAAEFQQANQLDPRVLLMASQSLKDAGKSSEAARFADQAAKFNALNFNYAFVRTKMKGETEAAAKTE